MCASLITQSGQQGMAVKSPRTIAEAGRALRSGLWTCEGLTRFYLEGIRKLNPVLHVMITVCEDAALEQAAILDRELQEGVDRGPLHGIPIVNKDLFAARGLPMTVGSPIFRNAVQAQDSAVIERLRRHGCILLGQSNLGEFAAVPVGRNRTYGDVYNPWQQDHTPGASSSGSAAALAAGLCLASTGSDTGGSVRTPASCCGVMGIRPTSNLISLEGSFPRSLSLDAAGVLAHSAEDMGFLLAALLDTPERAAEVRSPASIRLATIADFTYSDVDEVVATSVRQALEKVAAAGGEIVEQRSSLLSHELPTDELFTLLTYEFSKIMESLYASNPKELFDPCVHDDMRRGRSITDAQYQQAMVQRKRYQEQIGSLFEAADILVTPTIPTRVPHYDSPASIWSRQKRFLIPVSYLGLPALSLPCGLDDEGLPIGLQLIGRPYSEFRLLQAARFLEECGVVPAARPSANWS